MFEALASIFKLLDSNKLEVVLFGLLIIGIVIVWKEMRAAHEERRTAQADLKKAMAEYADALTQITSEYKECSNENRRAIEKLERVIDRMSDGQEGHQKALDAIFTELRTLSKETAVSLASRRAAFVPEGT